jgi:hypothetical protein
MVDTRPRITFKDGVCNACQYATEKRKIDWKAREEEFRTLLDEHKSDGPYDCVIPLRTLLP